MGPFSKCVTWQEKVDAWPKIWNALVAAAKRSAQRLGLYRSAFELAGGMRSIDLRKGGPGALLPSSTMRGPTVVTSMT